MRAGAAVVLCAVIIGRALQALSYSCCDACEEDFNDSDQRSDPGARLLLLHSGEFDIVIDGSAVRPYYIKRNPTPKALNHVSREACGLAGAGCNFGSSRPRP